MSARRLVIRKGGGGISKNSSKVPRIRLAKPVRHVCPVQDGAHPRLSVCGHRSPLGIARRAWPPGVLKTSPLSCARARQLAQSPNPSLPPPGIFLDVVTVPDGSGGPGRVLWVLMLVARAGCSSQIAIVRSRAIFASLGLLLVLLVARIGCSTSKIAIVPSRAICASLGQCS